MCLDFPLMWALRLCTWKVESFIRFTAHARILLQCIAILLSSLHRSVYLLGGERYLHDRLVRQSRINNVLMNDGVRVYMQLTSQIVEHFTGRGTGPLWCSVCSAAEGQLVDQPCAGKGRPQRTFVSPDAVYNADMCLPNRCTLRWLYGIVNAAGVSLHTQIQGGRTNAD